MHTILSMLHVGVISNGVKINTLAYADDVEKLAETESNLQA
jgi:hypothetical protein